MKVIVIGAGPAGLTAAYCLSKGGADVEVLEASGRIGGMSASIDLWGQRADLGPHRFFSADPQINALWKSVAGDRYHAVRRLTRIYYNHRFFYYPLRPFNALLGLGIFRSFLCGMSYFRAVLFPRKGDDTFEGWVSRRFGRRLYSIFFKTYSEKLWGISCRELDADFAAQRIKKFSLGEALKSMFSVASASRHPTLVDRFMYPSGGTGAIYEAMADGIRNNGGTVHVHSPVRRILVRNGKAYGVEKEDGTILCADEVLSTMPLTLAVQGFEDVPPAVLAACKKLRYRNTILVYLRVAGKDLFPDNWLYVHSADLMTGRITNFRNWVPELYGNATETIIAMEYWCYDEDALWTEPDDALIARAKQEFRSTGLNRGTEILDGHVERLHRSYPVYAVGYKEPLSAVVDYLHAIRGVSFIGRYGSFKYNNQDHSILMGMLAAENLLHGAGHDLWKINTGEEYQEAAKADETTSDA